MNNHAIKFKFCCRHCLHSEKEYSSIIFETKDYNKILSDTEYETIKKMFILGAFDHVKCPTCLSNNIMIYSLMANEKSIYSTNNIESCINSKVGIYMKFEKYGNRLKQKIQLSKNLDPNNHKHFWALERMLQHIIELVKLQTNQVFYSSISGNIEIMAFGKLDDLGIQTQINKFISIGITKNEIYKCLYEIGKKFHLNIDNKNISQALSNEKFSNNREEIESVKFKGALLNEMFTIDLNEEMEKSGFTKNNLCSKFGSKIIAFGVPDDIDPFEFYKSNKEEDFIIPPNTTPKIIKRNFVYYATKVEEEDDLPF